LSLRGGAAAGGRDYRQVNMGAGYEVNGLGIDYVFTMPLGAADDTGNMHNVALSFKFGSAISEDDLAEELREEKRGPGPGPRGPNRGRIGGCFHERRTQQTDQ
jgi:hypothetical protein